MLALASKKIIVPGVTNMMGRQADLGGCETVGGSQAEGEVRSRLTINSDRLFWCAYLRPEHKCV